VRYSAKWVELLELYTITAKTAHADVSL